MNVNRLDFLGGLAAAVTIPVRSAFAVDAEKPEYHAFSRVFQFLKDPYRTAEFLRSCGYDGVEWTVRPGGFVEPLQAATGLKRAMSAAKSAGIRADNIVVPFLRGDDAEAETIAMTAAEAGYKSFRGNYFTYDRTKTYRENMDAIRRGFDSLEKLAQKSGLKCCYQHHSTCMKEETLFGSLVLDLASILPSYDPKFVGVQYDPMHVRAEAGPSWWHTLGAVAPWIDIVCLKDFHFALDESGRDWKRVLVPAGKGIVDFAEMKRLMRLERVRPRFTIHYDYKFPIDELVARRFATHDLEHYRLIFG